jgi:RNA polymerase sigma-70 factor (ECF subfamily)
MVDHQLHERFISLLEANLGIILKISKAYTNTVQDREDLINDITFEMWKAYPNFKGKSKVST